MSSARRDLPLIATLAALAALYLWWFRADPHWLATLLVFVAPPFLLLIGVALQRPAARFWSSVLALFWFSHGVMSAWAHPSTTVLAWIEIALSLAVVTLVSLPGIRARFSKKR